MTNPTGEPPRSVLLRRLFVLIGEAKLPDRHAWASDILSREIRSYRELTTAEIQELIGRLVLESNATEPCRSVGPQEQVCVFHWPGHPKLCCNEHGIEWTPREI